MKKIYFFLCMAFLCQWSFEQNLLTVQNGSYTENFDGMGAAGTTYTANWTGVRFTGTGTLGLIAPVVSNGGSGTGAIFNAGVTGATDRSLGTLASATTIPAFGTSFQNSTGVLLLDINFSGLMKQWRTGSSNTITERIIFEYSLDATSLTTGTWTALPAMDLVEKLTTTTAAAAVDGSLAANQTAISAPINGINLPNGATIWIRWRDTDDTGSDGMYALDNFMLNYTSGGADVTPPTISSLTPANGSTTVSANQTFSIVFSEAVQKGTGNVYLKKASDGSTVQTLDVANAGVVVNSALATFKFNLLDLQTVYYIQIDSASFKDATGNSFVGITSNTGWRFTTDNRYAAFDFNTCSPYASVPSGFSQSSVIGDSIWKCTTFGRNNTGGVQMNGYVNATVGNAANEDWLISPSFNLSGATVPLLQFYSISAFIGPALRLMVSTDYVSGAPATATWTEIYGKFPADNSFVWTLSDSINLSNFKQPNVHLAWVYYSTIDEASRWTLDDVAIFNSSVVPSAFVVALDSTINVGFAPFVGNGKWQPVTINAGSVSGSLSFTASTNFLLARDTTTAGTATVSFTQTEANANAAKQFYVRLRPDALDRNFTGTISTTYGGITRAIASLFGTSFSPDKTLDIVNWNLEWFGTPAPNFGPTNKDQQFTNVLKVLRSIDADIFSLVEVVDTSRFRRLRDSLGSNYGSVVCNYGTRAVNPANGDYNNNIATAQKEGFIYKKSVFSNVTARPFLFKNFNDTLIPSSSYYWWSSGRFPYIMEADVTLENQTRHMVFVLLHAKANTGTDVEKRDSYTRRKLGILNMKDSLDANFSTANIVILGDYNDRLSGTIAPTTGADTVSSYQSFVADSTDANSYKSLTLPFVNVGTTSSGNSAIDNVIVSNELAPYYLSNSVQIRKDVTSLVNSYSTTTTDHYPIFSRFFFGQNPLPVTILSFTGTKSGEKGLLQWQVVQEVNVEKYIVEASTDGRLFSTIGVVAAAGNRSYQFTHDKPAEGNNFYRIKSVDKDGKFAYSAIVRLNFGKGWQVTLSPNPVKDVLMLQTSKSGTLSIVLYDAAGRKVKQFTAMEIVAGETRQLTVSKLAKGTYTVEIINGMERLISKIVAE